MKAKIIRIRIARVGYVETEMKRLIKRIQRTTSKDVQDSAQQDGGK